MFDADQYKLTTRLQWQDYAAGWDDWAQLLESWLGPATDRMLELVGVEYISTPFRALHQMLRAMDSDDQDDVWNEIETALSQYDTANGFVAPRELVIVGATR